MPIAPARAARLGVAGVAAEDELGGLVEDEQADRRVEPGHDLGAHADLGALGAHQQRRAPSGVDGANGSAMRSTGVSVMVVPRTSLLCMPMPAPKKNSVLANGPSTAVNFGLPIAALRSAGVGRIEDRVDGRGIEVAAPAERGAEPVGPVHGVLRIDADAAFADLVAADIGQERALERVGQAELDVVVAGLHAERRLDRQAARTSR